jgi:hypothetical protein
MSSGGDHVLSEISQTQKKTNTPCFLSYAVESRPKKKKKSETKKRT